VHALFNNAGASWGSPFEQFPASGWDKGFDVNVKGVFLLTQALLPMLKAASSLEDPSRVINNGSVDGIDLPGTGFDNFSYSAAARGHVTSECSAQTSAGAAGPRAIAEIAIGVAVRFFIVRFPSCSYPPRPMRRRRTCSSTQPSSSLTRRVPRSRGHGHVARGRRQEPARRCHPSGRGVDAVQTRYEPTATTTSPSRYCFSSSCRPIAVAADGCVADSGTRCSRLVSVSTTTRRAHPQGGPERHPHRFPFSSALP
jgi:hypothetical protein